MSAQSVPLVPIARPDRTPRFARAARWGGLLLFWCVFVATSVGCQDLLLRKKRKFGSTCGNPTECESGVCSHGVCTQTCGNDGDCGGDLCIESTCQQVDSDFDGDGLLNGEEKVIGTNPSQGDSDVDGIDDGSEVGSNHGHPKDSNADGTPDALQSNIADKDKDCIVDALDKNPNAADTLPSAKGICNHGVCATNIAEAKVVCDLASQGASAVGLAAGCTGCVCEAPGAPDWQAAETFCDALDNDCDGQTDEGLLWNKFPLGSPCQVVAQNVCALKPGKVECGTDKTATCSTLANGHDSLAKSELCNGVDDDCDGETDETFLWESHHVGDSCADTCGGTPLFCDAKKAVAIGGATVRCLDEQTVMCAGKPWGTSFVQLGQGVPQPQRQWTAGLLGPDKLLRFSGEVPASGYLSLRNEAWSLDIHGLSQAQSATQPWHHEAALGPPPRNHAALVWDGAHNRSLLVGGDSADWHPEIWSIAPSGAATEVSALAANDPLAVPPLDGVNVAAADQRPTLAVILSGPNAARTLLVVAPNLPAPLSLPLSPTPVVEWKPALMFAAGAPLPATPIGNAICLTTTPDGTRGLLITETGTAWLVEFDGQTPVLRQLGGQGGLAAVARTGGLCALDSADLLHVFGGQDSSGGLAKYVWASLSGIANSDNPDLPHDITWTVVNGPSGSDPAFHRVGGFAVWHEASQTIVVGGGWHPVATTTGSHAVGVTDIWAYAPSAGSATRLDTDVPAGRIGEAQAWRPATGQWCIAGGLTYGLPDAGKTKPRAIPVTDAWCVGPDGTWTAAGSDILFAFGMAGIDAAADRLVLAGGLELFANEEVPDLARLWTAGFPAKRDANGDWTLLEPALRPTKAVRTLDLATLALQSQPSTEAPGLAASSVAHDPLRNRLIVSGGFDDHSETHAFYALDLATLGWKNLGASVPPAPVCGGECHPVDRFGAPMVYDPVHDILAITAGSIRDQNKAGGGIGLDTGYDVNLGCFNFKGNTLWVGTTGVFTPTPTFAPSPVPNFADEAATKPLLQQYFGGPVFVPILFDWLGGRAWIAAQKRAVLDNLTCAGPAQDFLTAGTQVSLAVGLCPSPAPQVPLAPKALLEQQTIAAPSALIHAAAYFHVPTQKAWLFSGLEPDGSVASGLWQLAETCGGK